MRTLADIGSEYKPLIDLSWEWHWNLAVKHIKTYRKWKHSVNQTLDLNSVQKDVQIVPLTVVAWMNDEPRSKMGNSNGAQNPVIERELEYMGDQTHHEIIRAIPPRSSVAEHESPGHGSRWEAESLIIIIIIIQARHSDVIGKTCKVAKCVATTDYSESVKNSWNQLVSAEGPYEQFSLQSSSENCQCLCWLHWVTAINCSKRALQRRRRHGHWLSDVQSVEQQEQSSMMTGVVSQCQRQPLDQLVLRR